MNHLQLLYDRLHRQRRRLATAGVSLLAVWVLSHVVFGANGMMVYQRKRAEARQLQQQVLQVQQENDALVERTNALRNDRATIEKEAREQLHYAKPGEIIYLMPGQKAPEPPPANASAQKK